MLDRQTKKRIDDCRNILVGKITDPKSQVEQITIAMIYKFMDDMDLQSEEYGGSRQFFVGDYQKYSWSNIFSPRVDANEMLNLYGEGIEKMSENPNLNPLFRKIFKDAYLPFRDAETLKLFLRTIDGFSYENSENLGDAYEYLLSVLGSQGGAGQFRTPRHIIDFIVDLVQPKKGDRILDPACGTSGFLISSYKRILERNTDKKLGDKLSSMEKKHLLNSIYGYDLDPNMVRLSLVNLFLHGFTEDELNVIEYDSLTSEDRWNEYFDVILANPPFMTPKGGIRPHNRFSIKSNRAEVLFVNYIMEHLTPKGRAGIVVPEGIIFQSGTAYKQLRKSLVEKYLIGVISLPSGVFNPYSGVKTSILILDRELSQRTDKIFFGKVENDGYDLGAQRRQIDKNDLPKIKDSVLDYINNLKEGIDNEHPNLPYVSKEEILNSIDVGLSYDRYFRDDYKRFISKFPRYKLGSILEIQSGGRDKGGALSSGIPSIGGEQITPDGNIRFDRMKYVSESYYQTMKKGHLNLNDILMVKDGATTGKIGYYKGGFEKCAVNEHVYILRSNGEVAPFLLFQILRSQTFQNILKPYIKGIIGGVSSEIKEIEIPLPPIEIQKEIVEELEQYQKIIDGAKQVVDNYKPHIDVDESWEKVELGDIGKIISGGTPKSSNSNYWNGEIKWITLIDIPNNNNIEFLSNSKRKITDEGLKNSSAKIVPPNSIIISTRATIGRVAINKVILTTNQGFKNIIDIDESRYNIIFISYQLLQMKEYLNSLGTGGTFKEINSSNFSRIKVHIPPIEIQNQIAEKLEEEREIVEGNKKLIEIYTQKIEDRINKIWGE